MPAVRKLTDAEIRAEFERLNPKNTLVSITDVPKKRGRPAGSKNRPKQENNKDFEPEKLYTYTAADGCSIQSGIKSKTAKFTCQHGKVMEIKK